MSMLFTPVFIINYSIADLKRQKTPKYFNFTLDIANILCYNATVKIE